MPICIECSYPVSHLYSAYSRADDRALGKGVRLTQCPRCKRFADKYVEHDFVVIFIDLVLIKPQVRYRSYEEFQGRLILSGVPSSPLQPPRRRRAQVRSLNNPPRGPSAPF
ncbi:sterol homeostasis protein ARV1 [Aspergillus lucknowensis]|uniref:Protein ARV n=1 Tax=Aspergillus lucknowensis TaxID=176173 RepID=A0ABR4M6S8_9EURO